MEPQLITRIQSATGEIKEWLNNNDVDPNDHTLDDLALNYPEFSIIFLKSQDNEIPLLKIHLNEGFDYLKGEFVDNRFKICQELEEIMDEAFDKDIFESVLYIDYMSESNYLPQIIIEL